MLTKGSFESPESVEGQAENQTSEHKPENGLIDHTNLAAKAGMAKELCVLGLSNEAIGRVLHIHEDAVAHILNINDDVK